MADRTLMTLEAAQNQATDEIAVLAASKLRLFDGTLVPDVTTVKADMVAAETTLTGYPAGGYALAAWTGPNANPSGGVVITSPLRNVSYASGPAATIGGGWVETAGGDVRAVFVFDPPRTLAAVPDGFEFVRQLVYGKNPV